MSKRISELDNASQIPANPNSLLEIAEPNNGSPSGYVSRKIPLSSIGGSGSSGPSHRFYFSGTEILDGFTSFTFARINYSDLYLLTPSEVTQNGSFEAATIDVSLSVVGSDEGTNRVGASSSRIVYLRDDYTYMNYLASGSSNLNSNSAPISLPYFVPDYFGNSLPPIITNVIFDDDINMFSINASIATNPYGSMPQEITYRGYLDITVVRSMTGSIPQT
ncbi:hypothetical protein Xoosp13_297 [Xanthomonas phage Xoo-sp13]|nr:hypothetical protein Xoosp13_297 [Xanthomonas phage Xoo-sp13]